MRVAHPKRAAFGRVIRYVPHQMTATRTKSTAPASSRRGVHLRYALFLLVATLALLEIALQVGAFGLWLLQPPPPENADGLRTVLCVGDSWTHGIGSSDPTQKSYPAVVARSLGEEWTVANRGLSGRNSRELLEQLPSDLDTYRPEFVCVLVGQNDFWSAPERLHLDPGVVGTASGGFRWRVRTLRLAAWLAAKFTGKGQASDPPAQRGPEWEPRVVRAKSLPYRLPDEPWARDKESRAEKMRGWKSLERGEVDAAERVFRAVIEQYPRDPEAHYGLMNALSRASRHEEAHEQLDWLRRRYQDDPGFWVGRSFVSALRAVDLAEEALTVAEALVAKYPEDPGLWTVIGRSRFDLGDADGAIEAIERAIELHPTIDRYFWLQKFEFLGGDFDGCVRAVLRGYFELNDAEWLEDRLRFDAFRARLGRVAEIIVETECSPAQRARIETIARQAYAVGDDDVANVLKAHLCDAIELARAHGATPLILTYPVGSSANATLLEVAKREGVDFIDMQTLFLREVFAERPWSELRAPDGHFNDDGYEIYGKRVAAWIRAAADRK